MLNIANVFDSLSCSSLNVVKKTIFEKFNNCTVVMSTQKKSNYNI